MKTKDIKKVLLITLVTSISSSALLCQENSLSINLIETIELTTNLEYSGAVSKNMTFHLPLSWKPFITHRNERDKKIFFSPGIRFWKWYNYSGLFCGASLSAGMYNKTKHAFRYQGYATGLKVYGGYAKMISRNWNIEATAGIACFYTSYEKFIKGKCGDFEESKAEYLIRPSSLSLALVYIF